MSIEQDMNQIPEQDTGKSKSLDVTYIDVQSVNIMKEQEQITEKKAENDYLCINEQESQNISQRDDPQASDRMSERKVAGQMSDREAAGKEAAGKSTPRSKTLTKSNKNSKAKGEHRSSAKRIRTLFQETVSTKVKKQEKYVNEPQSRASDVGLKSHRTNPLGSQFTVGSPEKMENKQAPAVSGYIHANTNAGSNLNVRNITKPYNRMSTLKKKGSKIDNKDDDDGFETDEQHQNESQAEKSRRKQEWLDRFKRKPLDPEKDLNPDGTEKYKVRTKLMIKILAMKPKKDDEHSEDHMINSFDEEVSTVSYDEEDDEIDDEELKARKAKKKAKKKKAKKANMLKILQMNALKAKQNAMKKKKVRRPILNVYCTDYDVVKKAAKQTCGFRLKEYKEDHDGGIINGEANQKLAEDWDVTWHNGGITADFFAKMQPYQKVNQYPGIQCISRKNNLARNLVKIKKAFHDKFQFFPRTWILPLEASEFRNNFIDKYGRTVLRRKTFIVKPDNLAQGKGIFLSRNFDKIIEHTTQCGGGWVVQDYLSNPHLIEGLKYDLRLYVFLYGLNPLRIFIHEQGLARFATEPYEKPRNSNLDNMYVHLTNYAINKLNRNFKQSNKKKARDEDDYGDYGDYGDEYDDEDEEETGHKRSLFAIMKIIYQQGGDPDKIWEEIKDIVVKTIIVGQPYMDHMYRVCQPECIDNSMCFQILGFDIMIDKNFRPWLIEVNQSPSFSTDSPLDYEVKKNVLRDALQMLDMSQERRENYIRIRNEQNQERMMTGKTFKMTPQEREKLRHDRIQARMDFERIKLNGSGYEQIFPQIYDEEKNAEYEVVLKKAQEIWDDFTTGKQKRHRIQEEQEKKRQEAQQMSNMLIKSVKKRTSKAPPETASIAENKDEIKSDGPSSSDEGALKQTNSSIDKKEGDQSERSPKDHLVSKTESKAPQAGKLVTVAANRNSYNVDMLTGKGGNPFVIKPGLDSEQKSGGASQMAPAPTMTTAIQKLSENRNSIGNQNGRRMAMDEAARSNPAHSHPLQKSLKPNMIHMDLQAAHAYPHNTQQTPSQFTNRRKQPIVLHPKQIHQSTHGLNRQTASHGQPNQQQDPFSSKETANEQDMQAKTSIDSRPSSSNPQGSPSKRYHHLGEAVSRADIPPQDPSSFSAQKQYLEDIVQRQEQKIKYYQRIIQQQRLIDDKILQTTAGMNAAAADASKLYTFRNDVNPGLTAQQMPQNAQNSTHPMHHQQLPPSSSSTQQPGHPHANSRVMSEGRHSENLGNASQVKRVAGITPGSQGKQQYFQHTQSKLQTHQLKSESEVKGTASESNRMTSGLHATGTNMTTDSNHQPHPNDSSPKSTQHALSGQPSTRPIHSTSNPSDHSRQPLNSTARRPSQSLSTQLHQSIGAHLTKFEQELLPQMVDNTADSNNTINPQTRMTRTDSIRQTSNHFAASNQKSVQHHPGHQGHMKANQNMFMSRMANVGLQHIQNSGTKAKVPTAMGPHLPPPHGLEMKKGVAGSGLTMPYPMGGSEQQMSQSVQEINGLQPQPMPGGQGNPGNHQVDSSQAAHHKLIIDAIRGEGIERTIFQKSNNFFQGSIPNRFQGQNVTHEMNQMSQEPRPSSYINTTSLSTNSQSKTLKNIIQPFHDMAYVMSRDHALAQPGPNTGGDPIKTSHSITSSASHNQPAAHNYKIDHSYQHLISSLNVGDQSQQQSLIHGGPVSGHYAMVGGRQHQVSPKYFASSGMQSLSLQGIKKECHNPQKRFDQFHHELKGRAVVSDQHHIIQPVQVEFSKVIDDQANFEKTKKDQFRDYKNLVVQDQAKEESRFKVQKRSVYTQPGSGMPQNLHATAVYAPAQRQQYGNKTVSITEVGDDNLFIQSSKIHFQDQMNRKQVGGDLENNRKSLDMQNYKGYHNGQTQQQMIMMSAKVAAEGAASHHYQSPAIKMKKMEPSWNDKGSPASMIGTKQQQNLQYPGALSQNQRLQPNASLSPLKSTHTNNQPGYRTQINNRPQMHGRIAGVGGAGQVSHQQHAASSQVVGSGEDVVQAGGGIPMHEVKQMGSPSKEPRRASGFNVKSPILSNQGYQIAGMSQNANPKVNHISHNSASQLKENDSFGGVLQNLNPLNTGQKPKAPPAGDHHAFTVQILDKHASLTHPSIQQNL